MDAILNAHQCQSPNPIDHDDHYPKQTACHRWPMHTNDKNWKRKKVESTHFASMYSVGGLTHKQLVEWQRNLKWQRNVESIDYRCLPSPIDHAYYHPCRNVKVFSSTKRLPWINTRCTTITCNQRQSMITSKGNGTNLQGKKVGAKKKFWIFTLTFARVATMVGTRTSSVLLKTKKKRFIFF